MGNLARKIVQAVLTEIVISIINEGFKPKQK